MSRISNGGDGPESTTDSTSQRKSKQKRVSLACQICKKRKIRCDGNPEGCENCKGFGTECEYIGSGVKRGPQTGFRLKRKWSVAGEHEEDEPIRPQQNQRRRESRSPVTDLGQDGSLSRSPAIGIDLNTTHVLERTSDLNAPGSVPDQPQGSASSPSPPLASRYWTDAQTDGQVLQPVAPHPPYLSDGQNANELRRGRQKTGHMQVDNNSHRQTSPNMETAIQALESLSEVRHYPQPQYSSTSAHDRRVNDAQYGVPELHQPPSIIRPARSNAQQGPGPSSMASASHRTILSMPPSSNNSDDGMAHGMRSFEHSSLGHDASGGLHIDRHTRDRLLAVYWTHIHNVWPLLYKPEFYASTVHRPVLLAMLAAASAIPTPGKSILNASQADLLFEQARDAVLIRRRKVHAAGLTDEKSHPHGGQQGLYHEIAPATSSLQTVQCMLLFSLRQTSNGNKSSAYLWFCHAAAMTLELSLHRVVLDKSKHIPQGEIESRCRVFWSCYVMDKSFSEEMGRPVLLRASTTTTPLPSTLEADEYELWPPPSVSIGQKSRSRSGANQLHIQPMKSRTITCFNATVRLAYLVEQCLDLDNELLMSSTTSSHNESRQLVVMDNAALQEELARIETQKAQLARKLTDWWDRLNPDLRVDFEAKICPPIHFVVNCCWYYSATIFLHSKNIGSKGISGSRSELYLTSHRICSEAAGNIVTLLGCLDRFKILAPASSDIMHMLSHAALFHAYNAAIPNNEFAASAEANFHQCCLWLQEIGSFWAPASVQRQFFEGLVKGGKELTAKTRPTGGHTSNSAALSGLNVDVISPLQILRHSPSQTTSSLLQQQDSVTGGLQEQSATYIPSSAASNTLNMPDSSDIFRVRSHFWNEFLPNAEQFNADRRESDIGSFANGLSEDLGSLYDLSAVSSSEISRLTGGPPVMAEELNLAAIASLAQGTSLAYPSNAPTHGGHNSGTMANIDPSDWLVTYMLDSLQQNKS